MLALADEKGKDFFELVWQCSFKLKQIVLFPKSIHSDEGFFAKV